VTGPIFDGGYRRAEVEHSRAVLDERLAAYRNTVLTAIREVEDALTREQQYRDFLINIDKQLRLTEMAYREATWRYLNGLNDFLPVLREQINLITFQLDRIKTGADLLKARIGLYKALGGSWMADIAEPALKEK
jgi:outer membrane protein TolC